MINITTDFYYRDSEVEILGQDASGPVKLGYSTDTKALFITDNTRWHKIQLEVAADPNIQYSSMSSRLSLIHISEPTRPERIGGWLGGV